MSGPTSALPAAILKACGIDPATVSSMTFTADAYHGGAWLTVKRFVANADTAQLDEITEEWRPV